LHQFIEFPGFSFSIPGISYRRISKGIGYGFISCVLLKLLTGKIKDVHPLLIVAAVLFGVDFYLSEKTTGTFFQRIPRSALGALSVLVKTDRITS
jgi:uncharacterized membrane protein YjjP (DUF1212 family)